MFVACTFVAYNQRLSNVFIVFATTVTVLRPASSAVISCSSSQVLLSSSSQCSLVHSLKDECSSSVSIIIINRTVPFMTDFVKNHEFYS